MARAYELIIVAYRDPGQAADSLNALQKAVRKDKVAVITAAAISKDISGKTNVEATLDLTRKRGTRIGALTGGLLAVLVPAVGVASLAAGAAAGGLIGRKVIKKPDADFTTGFVDGVKEHMAGGSSTLVVLAEQKHGDQVVIFLAKFGGQVTRQPLPEKAVRSLVKRGKQQQDETTPADAMPIGGEKTIDWLRQQVQNGTRREGPQFASVFVIINPASGKDDTILNKLNAVFRATNLEWEVGITKKAGDATEMARQAAADGYDVVAAYGGDGTVMEAASGLAGTDVPLAILPGGTNNVMSVELGVPKDLVEAAALIGAGPVEIRAVDMGRANDRDFILRVGIGYEAVINETADREMKDRFGGFAYSLAGIKALKNPPIATYRLEMDGQVEELEGLWCMVANSASLGVPNLDLVNDISISDGLLDVIIVREADLDSLLSVVSSITGAEKLGKPLPHWQARHVTVQADPPQAVTGDGEIWDDTPLKIEVIPSAVNILVPASPT